MPKVLPRSFHVSCGDTFASQLHLYGLHKVWRCIDTQDRQVMLRVCGHNARGELR